MLGAANIGGGTHANLSEYTGTSDALDPAFIRVLVSDAVASSDSAAFFTTRMSRAFDRSNDAAQQDTGNFNFLSYDIYGEILLSLYEPRQLPWHNNERDGSNRRAGQHRSVSHRWKCASEEGASEEADLYSL
ncbi:unnamed protein product [Toxocara canis]|uniref:PEROXIDASE_4 domain-containing protein n=1 Tax=Toxocara canis TaxID=6265 RepID=A0A183V5W4_TOXCA|nr:unnamed protein product [Toxocara canis]